MAQRTILVIEDDMTWHKLFSRMLGGAGYKVLIVATCADGIKLAALHKPDCILLDFHLPDGDAISVCSAIRSDKSTEKTSVIIFSSDPGAEEAAYTRCKAVKFVFKGHGALLEELRIAIDEILNHDLSTRFDD